MRRREFFRFVKVATAIGWGGGAYVLAGAACRRQAEPGAPPDLMGSLAGSGLTFSSAELRTIGAVCERLLPRDGARDGPGDPGALDLGVPSFIDRMLASPELKAQRDLLRQVLPILDRQSRIRFGGKAFHEATIEQQDGLLAQWQRGRGGDQRFFETMLTLTLEGAFGDPKYGGNVGGRGFALVGFTPVPVMSTGMKHG